VEVQEVRWDEGEYTFFLWKGEWKSWIRYRFFFLYIRESYQQLCIYVMYEGWATSGPCIATFTDLLCFSMKDAQYY
jgi:hypothetical protein